MQEEGWVVCRVFKKRIATTQKMSEHDSPVWYDDHVSFMESPNLSYYKKEMSLPLPLPYGPDHFIQLPLLQSPNKVVQNPDLDHNFHVTDWRVLDKFVASQLSHEEVSKENEGLGEFNVTTSSCQIDLWK